jgi:Mce-associated membrane protein
MRGRSTTQDVFDRIVEHDDPADDEIGMDVDKDEAHDAVLDAADALVDDDEDAAELAEAPADVDDEIDAEVEDADIEDAVLDAPPRPRGRRWLRRCLAAAAVVVFVAAVGLAAFFGWQLKQQDDTAAAGRAALNVATSYAVTLTSIDNQKIDENFTQVLDGATGEFKDMYSQSAAQLRQLLIDNKAVSHGTVVDSAIKSATKDKVEVLIFIDQSISNSVNTEPRIDRTRIAMTMERIDNRWLASKVDIK